MLNLKCGDCLNLIKDIPDNSVDLVLTDPPYKTVCGGDSNGVNSVRPKGMLSGNRKLFKYQNNILPSEWMPEIYRILKENTHCYIFVNSMNLFNFIEEANRVGFKLHNILVWKKNNCTPSQYYMKNCEYVLFLRKGKAKYINNIGNSKTVHEFNNIIGKKLHPTQKPVDLLEFYINNSSYIGDCICDPFMGSGSTGVAAINTGRDFIGFELDPKYFEIAKQRIVEKYHEQPLHIESLV